MQIHWRNPSPIPEEEQREAEERLRTLAEERSDLIDIWLDVEKSTHHRHGSGQVTIRCQARGADLIAHGHDIEAPLALRRALDTFVRDVRRLRAKRKDRRMERPPRPPHLGVVDRVFPEEDYGFLLTDSGEQVYFHRNAVGEGLSFDGLEEGQRVALNYEAGEKGSQATFVAVPPADAPTP